MAFLTGFQFRIKINTDNTKIDGTLTDFPVLVRLNSGNFDFSKARSDGFDIRFTSDDELTLLKYERERHDNTAQLAEYHVKVPSISSSVDQDIYMYFGKSDATDGADAINVWDANFFFVSHMTNVTTSTVKNSVDGASFSKTSAGNPAEVSGQVYKAQDFTSDYIELGDLDMDGDSTLESLVKPASFVSTDSIVGCANTTGNGESGDFSLLIASGSIQVLCADNSTFQNFVTTLSPTQDVWQYIASRADGTDLAGFLGNTKQTQTQTVTPTSNANSYRIGKWGEYSGNFFFDGDIGEIRMSSSARVDAWLKATKETLFDTLLTYGAEETSPIQENIDLTETVVTNVSLIKQIIIENIDLTENISKSIAKAVQEFIDLTEVQISNVNISQLVSESLPLSDSVGFALVKSISENLALTEFIDPSPSDIETSLSEFLQLTEIVSASIPSLANNASRIINYNPLIFVTDTDPAKIVEVITTDPENPTHTTFTLTGAKNAKDVVRNSVTGFLYVACADGIVIKVDETDLNSQTIIDLSDTDELQVIEVLEAFNITYISTDNSTGELYMIDDRTTVLGDFRLDVLTTITQFGDFQFDAIQVESMDGDFTVLSTITTGFAEMNFNCLGFVTIEGGPDVPIDLGSPVTPLDQLVPIKRTDFVILVDTVQLEQFDVDLSSIQITHNIEEESVATFNLNRRHDQMDLDLDGNTRQITDQNAIKITIQGREEFNGFVSNLNCQYNETEELITVTATATEKVSAFNNILLSLPDNTSRLTLYDILVQNPQIFNPVIDPLDENPKRFKGVKVQLGQKIAQSYFRLTEIDSFGTIAGTIQDGTFVPKQNNTYFWGPKVRKFGNVVIGEGGIPEGNEIPTPEKTAVIPTDEFGELGEVTAIRFFHIGTSLSPVSEDTWDLINAHHRRQRKRDDIITELGEYTVGVAPFKEINVRNGILIPKLHWVDEANGLYSIRDAEFNFEDYAKEVADLEYQKMLNINGEIFPETSCDIQQTIDGYYYHEVTLLSRINIDNTTQSDIYKNSNGFPVSVKGITINSGNMKVTLSTNNLKSNDELEELDGQFPDETDDRFNIPAIRELRLLKTDMKTRLKVE